MSVDQRIREGLAATNAALPEPDVVDALGAVTSKARTTARRRRLVRGGVAAVAAAAAAAAVVIVAVNGTGGDEPAVPIDRTSQLPEPTEEPTDEPTTEPSAATKLPVGTYLSDSVSFEQIAENVRAQAGGGAWVEPLRQRLGMVDGRQIRLVLDGDTITATIPGTSFEYARPYRLKGSSIVIDFPSTPKDWSWWGHYTLDGSPRSADRPLTVSFQEWFAHGTGCPCVGGVAYSVLAMALYGTAQFTFVP